MAPFPRALTCKCLRKNANDQVQGKADCASAEGTKTRESANGTGPWNCGSCVRRGAAELWILCDLIARRGKRELPH